MSYTDHRPALRISSLPVTKVDFLSTGRIWLACQHCGRWVAVRERSIATHRAADNVTRCKASGRKVEVDVSAAEHRQRRALAVAETAQRRPVYSNQRAHHEPTLPTPRPLNVRPGKPRTAQTTGWTGREDAFANPGQPWNMIPRAA